MSIQQPKPESIQQPELESRFGLTEIVMLRLPLVDWATANEIAEITQIAKAVPLPEQWWTMQDHILRNSQGFQDWLRRLADGTWRPDDDESSAKKLDAIDFRLPWCARTRWGAGNVQNVDIFVHATGGTDKIRWKSIH
jgi:hypothetical protein